MRIAKRKIAEKLPSYPLTEDDHEIQNKQKNKRSICNLSKPLTITNDERGKNEEIEGSISHSLPPAFSSQNNNEAWITFINSLSVVGESFVENMSEAGEHCIDFMTEVGKSFSAYMNDALPLIKITSFATGCVTGYPVGIVEHFFGIPPLVKLAFHDDEHLGPKHSKDFIESLGVKRTNISPAHLYFAETGFAAIASWVGRAIGFALAGLLAILISPVAVPLHNAYKNSKALDKENKAAFFKNSSDASSSGKDLQKPELCTV